MHQDFRRPSARANAPHGLLQNAATSDDVNNDYIAVGRPDDRPRRHGTARRRDGDVVPDVGEPRQRFLGQDRAQPVCGCYKGILRRLLVTQRCQKHAQGAALEPLSLLIKLRRVLHRCELAFVRLMRSAGSTRAARSRPASETQPSCQPKTTLLLAVRSPGRTVNLSAAAPQTSIRITRATQRSAKTRL